METFLFTVLLGIYKVFKQY